jgi:hypothetical protein
LELCILHVGTINDITNGDHKVIVPRLSELTYQINKKCPGVEIVVSAILPRPRDYGATRYQQTTLYVNTAV